MAKSFTITFSDKYIEAAQLVAQERNSKTGKKLTVKQYFEWFLKQHLIQTAMAEAMPAIEVQHRDTLKQAVLSKEAALLEEFEA